MIQNLHHLQISCRRGMLELDVLLGTFLATCYPHLNAREQGLFKHLLTYQDQQLYDWLINGLPVDKALLNPLIQKIREQRNLTDKE